MKNSNKVLLLIAIIASVIIFSNYTFADHIPYDSCTSNSDCSSGTCDNGYCTIDSTSSCSSGSYSNCYDSGSCSGAGGYWCNGYCQSSSCSGSGSCSSGDFAYCYTESECSSASGYWCSSGSSGWCQSSSCSSGGTCTVEDYYYCVSKSECEGVGRYWTGSECWSSSGSECASGMQWCGSYCAATCPGDSGCNKDNYWYCYDKSSCTGASGKWCGTYCSDDCPTCDSSQKHNCFEESSCTTAGGNWCKSTGSGSGYCTDSSCPTCSTSQPWNCYDSSSCTSSGGKWCGSYCDSYSCPTCEASQPWNCNSESDCTAASGKWCTSGSGSGKSSYCTDSCPTCNSASPWNCYSETECKSANSNWCGTYCSSTSCPTCSSSQKYNCYDEGSCTTAGGNWCGTWCDSYSCPVCSSTSQWNCKSETECKTAGGNWCTPPAGGSSFCQSGSCATYTCSKSEPWNCYTKTDCTNSGAFWCSNYCQSTSCPTCSASQPWNCYTASECTSAGKEWCESSSGTGSGWCSDSCPRCDANNPWNCNTENSCKTAGGKWCSTYCSDNCPTCSVNQPWNCFSETECKSAGKEWCSSSSTPTTTSTSSTPYTSSGWCTDSCPKCESGKPWNCYTENTCKTTGGNWCGTYCSDNCPTCSKSQPWNCYTKSECGSAGGQWCTDYCSDKCPTCSTSQPWNCKSESECTSKKGNWCGSWCSTSKCPSCDASNIWNCYDEISCSSAGGNWCLPTYSGDFSGSKITGWCDKYECPTCKTGNVYSCSTETECSTAGGNWCGSWCSDYKCPSVCGDGICNAGESNSYCPVDCPKSSQCPSSIDVSVNKNSFEPGDTRILTIKVKDSNNNPIPNIKLEMKKADGTRSTSATTDSNGEYKNEKIIDDKAAAGKKEIIIKAKVTDCKEISKSVKYSINSAGYCGDNVCSSKESLASCPWDCGESYCPESRQCPFGDTSSCISSKSGCFCETCHSDPGKIPSGCEQVKNPSTGMLSVTCESSCPPPPSNINRMKEICSQNGGKPDLKTDKLGCGFFECSFANEPNFYSGYDRCFSDSEIEGVRTKCDKLGLPFRIIKAGSDCRIAKCEQTSDFDECPLIPLSEKKEIETECELEGLLIVQDFDEGGCASIRCGTPDDCTTEIPEATYDNCNLQGGELSVRRDVNECVTFTECLTRGDDRDINVDIKTIPEEEDLLAMVLKVEGIIVQMSETATELREIGAYYKSIESNEYTRFDSSATSLDAMISEIQEVKSNLADKIESEEITLSDVREFVYELKFTVKVGLKDVLWKLLSSAPSTEFDEEVGGDCEFDFGCFDSSLRVCEPATYFPEEEKGDRSIIVEITGIEDGRCVLNANLPEGEGPPTGTFPGLEPPYSMTCKTEKYVLGASEPDKSIFPYCEGALADLINTYSYGNEEETSSVVTASVIAFLEENKGPAGCVGNLECIKFCNRKPLDCLSYIENQLKTNSGPGGTRSILEMESYCDKNKESCESWFSSKGVPLPELNSKKENAKHFSITGGAIRRQ